MASNKYRKLAKMLKHLKQSRRGLMSQTQGNSNGKFLFFLDLVCIDKPVERNLFS